MYTIFFYQIIMMWKPGIGRLFFIKANSLYRQRWLGTNMVVIKRVDCTRISCSHGHILALKTYSYNIFFDKKISSAYYICCIYSDALQYSFAMEANTMHPDQTALGTYCLQNRLPKHWHVPRQTSTYRRTNHW